MVLVYAIFFPFCLFYLFNVVVCLPWLNATCLPKPLFHFPPQLDWGEKVMEGSWVKIRTGRVHSAITITGKRDLTWENLFSLIPVKLELEYGSKN